MQIYLKNSKDTVALGKIIAERIENALVIILEGPLGVGKTTLTKGLALGLDIDEMITSPTFTIVKQYQGRLALNHIDAYRLEGLGDDFGLEDYIYDEAVTVIEWAEYLASDFTDYLLIRMHYDDEGRRCELIEKGNIDLDLEGARNEFRNRHIN